MEQLFGTQLRGVFLDALSHIQEEKNLTPEELEHLEKVTKLVQYIVEVSVLTLENENKALKEENSYLKKQVGDLRSFTINQEDKLLKLELENKNLLQSLVYLKEVSEKQDELNEL